MQNLDNVSFSLQKIKKILKNLFTKGFLCGRIFNVTKTGDWASP